jgi:hypothetical protein
LPAGAFATFNSVDNVNYIVRETASTIVDFACTGGASTDTALLQAAFTAAIGQIGGEFHDPQNGQQCTINAPIVISGLLGSHYFHGNTVSAMPAARTISVSAVACYDSASRTGCSVYTTPAYPHLVYTISGGGTPPAVNQDVSVTGMINAGNDISVTSTTAVLGVVTQSTSTTFTVSVPSGLGINETGSTGTATITNPCFILSDDDEFQFDGGKIATSSSSPCGVAIQIQQDSAAGPTFSERNTVKSVRVDGTNAGGAQICFGVMDGAVPDQNNYGHHFEDNSCDNYTSAAHYIAQTQYGSLYYSNEETNSFTAGGQYAYWNQQGASFTVSGGLVTASGAADVLSCTLGGDNLPVVTGVHSENSYRAFVNNCYYTPGSMVWIGNTFSLNHLASDGHVMLIQSPGAYIIEGNSFVQGYGSVPPDIYLNQSAGSGIVGGLAIGNTSPVTTHSLIQVGNATCQLSVNNIYLNGSGIPAAPSSTAPSCTASNQ